MFVKAIGFQQSQQLSIVHLATASHDTLSYICSDGAIRQKLMEVREVSETGCVNRIEVLNHSDAFIFMMDGDVLAGAKQTRVLNTSIFLAPKSKTVIPVSCVEQGRWRYVSPSFSGPKYSAPTTLRASNAREVHESLKSKRGHAADQHRVWNSVETYLSSSKCASSTASLGDLFDRDQDAFEDFTKDFRPHGDANGFAVFVGTNLLSIDLFNRRDVYSEYFTKILRGVAAEVLHLQEHRKPIGEAEAKFRAVDMLDRIDAMDASEHPGVALGTERRFESQEVTGFRLTYDDLLVHMTVLRIGETGVA